MPSHEVIVPEGTTDNVIIPLREDDHVRRVAELRKVVEAQPCVSSVISVLAKGQRRERHLIVVLKKGYDANEAAVILRRALNALKKE